MRGKASKSKKIPSSDYRKSLITEIVFICRCERKSYAKLGNAESKSSSYDYKANG